MIIISTKISNIKEDKYGGGYAHVSQTVKEIDYGIRHETFCSKQIFTTAPPAPPIFKYLGLIVQDEDELQESTSMYAIQSAYIDQINELFKWKV